MQSRFVLLTCMSSFVGWWGDYLPAQTIDPLTNKGYNHVPAAGSGGMHETLRLFPALHMHLLAVSTWEAVQDEVVPSPDRPHEGAARLLTGKGSGLCVLF